MSAKVYAYTDGACRGKPGPGGWGVVLRFRDRERELWGGEQATTNNRMELLAAIKALESLNRPCCIVISTDSLYLLKGITEWLPNWIRRGWKTASRAAVKNVDLWQRLVAAEAAHEVKWVWVKGHSGHPENERADRLANKAIDEMLAGQKTAAGVGDATDCA